MRTRISRRAVRSPLLAIALVAAFAGTVVATGATGFSATPLARGTLSTNVQFNTGDVKLQTKGDVDFVHSMVTIQPNGSSGWHTHPGIVLVTVASGSLTFYDDQCHATEHPAGSSFVESGNDAGLVRNLSSSVTATVYAMYLVPVGDDRAADRQAQPGLPAVLTAPSRTAGTFLGSVPASRFLNAARSVATSRVGRRPRLGARGATPWIAISSRRPNTATGRRLSTWSGRAATGCSRSHSGSSATSTGPRMPSRTRW